MAVIDDEGRDQIDRAFAINEALADASSSAPGSLTKTALAMRLLSDEIFLSADEWTKISGSKALLGSWNYLKRARTVASLPRVSAASRGGVAARDFDNGSVTITPSARPGIHYVKLVWRPVLPAPRQLMLERDDGPPVARLLPLFRPSGDFLLICDERLERDRQFLDLLADPRTSGWFMA